MALSRREFLRRVAAGVIVVPAAIKNVEIGCTSKRTGSRKKEGEPVTRDEDGDYMIYNVYDAGIGFHSADTKPASWSCFPVTVKVDSWTPLRYTVLGDGDE